MRPYQAERQIKSRLYSRPVIAVLFILLIFIGNGVYDIYLREKESSRMLGEAESKLTALQGQKNTLAKEEAKLESEEGIDEKIRSKFNVAKPGENVVLIVDDATTTATSTPGFFAALWAKIWK